MSRPTVSTMAWPLDEASLKQARDWADAASTQILFWTWSGYDSLLNGPLAEIDLEQPLDQLERDLTRLHFIEIQCKWVRETSGFAAIVPHHEYPELESRSSSKAKPPAYDLAFVWRANPRVAWPLEAKVLNSPNGMAQYLHDTEKFTNGTAAPITGIGAQIAYLLEGDAREFFGELSKRLGMTLDVPGNFASRAHRLTHHQREFRGNLALHHLTMELYLD